VWSWRGGSTSLAGVVDQPPLLFHAPLERGMLTAFFTSFAILISSLSVSFVSA
jgi:hypothetical protein